MSQPDHTKTDTEKAREEELIQRLVLKIDTYIFFKYLFILLYTTWIDWLKLSDGVMKSSRI